MTQINTSGSSLRQTPTLPHSPTTSSLLVCLSCTEVSSHSVLQVHMLPVSYGRSVFCQVSEAFLSSWMASSVWSCHLVACYCESRCVQPSESCVQPHVSVPCFIIGSDQRQRPGRRGCRWLRRARLPCLSERLRRARVN